MRTSGGSHTDTHPKWSIRRYEKGDERGILDLFRATGITRTSEEWGWEYKENPYGSIIHVVEYKSRIVGHIAYLRAPMKLGERNGMGCQSVDVVVHPKFRGQGIFLAIQRNLVAQADNEGIDIIYGFPNNPSGHLRAAGPHSHIVCKIPQLVKFVDLDKSLFGAFGLSGFPKIPEPLAEFASFLLKIIIAANRCFSRLTSSYITDGSENLKFRIATSFDERIDDFWGKVSKFYDIALVRDKTYLDWRYFKKPNTKYKALVCEKNDAILGYSMFLSKGEKNVKTGYIIDILALSQAVARALLMRTVECLKKENVKLIRCLMLKSSVHYKILRSCNFIPTGSTWFVARDNPKIPEESVADSTRWYVTLGDTDYI